MYHWIWRRLPGGVPGKLIGSLLLLVGVVALLFLVVFPYVGPRLPWDTTTVHHGGFARLSPVVVYRHN
jgi:hypothetical protein